MDEDAAQWSVAIGRVARAHGLRGALGVVPMTSHLERFRTLERVCVCLPDGERHIRRVAACRLTRGRALLTLEGVPDRTAAEALRGAVLTVTPEMRHSLDPDEYFVDDLVGLTVVTTDGRELGAVLEVLSLPANDVYVTEYALIPAVKQVIRAVDLEAGRITVQPIEGLAPELGI